MNKKRNEKLEQQLAVYALGGLSEEDSRRFEEYLRDHPELQEELKKIQDVVDALPYAAEPLDPSPVAEGLLFSRIEASLRQRPEQTYSQVSTAGTTVQEIETRPQTYSEDERVTEVSWWQRFLGMFQQPLAAGMLATAAAVSLAVVVMLSTTNSQLQQRIALLESAQTDLAAERDRLVQQQDDLLASVKQLADQNSSLVSELNETVVSKAALQTQLDRIRFENDDLSENLAATNDQLVLVRNDNQTLTDSLISQQPVLDLLASPNAELYSLPGTELSPEATASLVVDRSNSTALLLVSGLPPLESGLEYQVLLIRDENSHDTADTFEVDTEGEQVLLVNADFPLDDFSAVGVSIEPEGGSPQRTGEVILLGGILN